MIEYAYILFLEKYFLVFRKIFLDKNLVMCYIIQAVTKDGVKDREAECTL